MKLRGRDKGPVLVKSETRVSDEEAARLIELLDIRNEREVALKRAQIAFETAALDFIEVEQRVARKYQLGKGDVVNADGAIVRAQ